MIPGMRLTIDLSDELVRSAEARAHAAGETLEALVERAVAREVGGPSNALQDAMEYPLIRGRRVQTDVDPDTLDGVLTADEAQDHTT